MPDPHDEAVLPQLLQHFQDMPEMLQVIQRSTRSAQPEPPEPRAENQPEKDETFFQQLGARLPRPLFQSLSKCLLLYYHAILSKHDLYAMVPAEIFERPADHEHFVRFVEEVEVPRRKASLFKPLNDIDFSTSLRATHSYVKMPEMYPVDCRGKANSPYLQRILNDKWVSVPSGSEHETFNILAKNQYEELLIKCEDERYSLDIVLSKIKRAITLLEYVVGRRLPEHRHTKGSKCDIDSVFREVADLRILPLIYKPTYKEDKI
jgi:histone deacetylase complex regulatory component SIN3